MELAMIKITVLIFTHVSIVISTLIIQTNLLEAKRLQEQRFTLDGWLLGNAFQQPRSYFAHTAKFVLEY